MSLPLADEVLVKVATPDRRAAAHYFAGLIDGGVPLGTLVDSGLAPAMARVGELWETAVWSVVDEHSATAVAEAGLSAAADRCWADGSRGELVVACAEGDLHSLPARMVAEVLVANGWAVQFLGASHPTSQLIDHLAAHRPDAVLIACSVPMALPALMSAVHSIRALDLPVYVGGRALGRSDRRARAIGANGWAPDAVGIVELLAHRPVSSVGVDVAAPLAGYQAVQEMQSGWADEAMDALVALMPAVATYPPEIWNRTRADLLHLLDMAAITVLLADPTVLAEQCDWLDSVLAARGVPADALVHGLTALLTVRGDDDARSNRVVEALDEARRHLADVRAQPHKALEARDGERRLRSLVRKASDLTIVCSADAAISYVSPSALAVLGIADADLRGRPIAEILHPDDVSAHLGKLISPDATAIRAPVDLRLRRADDSYVLMETYLTDLKGEPSVRGTVASMRDVTERARRDADLRQAQKLEAVGQLAAGIAHEINTPIQFMGDNLRFLGDAFEELVAAARPVASTAPNLDVLGAEVRQAVEQSLDGIDRVAAVVRAMLAFGRPRTDERSAADMNQIIRDVLIVTNYAISEVADVHYEPGVLPPVWCNVDDVNQILVNLIVNAVQAMSDAALERGGRGLLTVRTCAAEGDVAIEISDTGLGIPDEIASRVFDPFFTTRQTGRGSGKGLSVAYALATKRHGGSLTFVSNAETGTTFTLRLPAGDTAAPHPPR